MDDAEAGVEAQGEAGEPGLGFEDRVQVVEDRVRRWLDLPALTRFTASHPRLLHPFAQYNRGKPYPAQVKPANFLLVAHLAPGGYPPGADPARFALVAPYTPDPTAWRQLAWRNVHDPAGPTYQVSTETIMTRHGHPLPPGVAGVRSYHDILDAYRTHPEPKSLGPDGRPCRRNTRGLLHRRPVQALSITHIGKETNLLDEIQAGLIGDEEDVLTEYVDLSRDPFARYVIPVLRDLPAARIAEGTGLNLTTVKRIRSRRVQPSPRSRTVLTTYAGAHAFRQLSLRGDSSAIERDDIRACARHLALRGAADDLLRADRSRPG